MIGKTILGYTVDEKIGSGAFGTVYKVSKSNVSGTYTRALKHITIPTKKQYIDVLNSMGGDYSKADNYFAEVLKRVTGEIQIISRLSETGCKNIVRYYENDIVETPPPRTYDIYILMEYLTPFDDFILNNEMKVSDVIKLGKDILAALVSCHSQNIIHRDIKDDNIFVGADNTYKLGDFGVSKLLNDRSRAESMKGTPNYIAPEVYLGKEKYDNTVDLYSLGIVMYRLLNKLRFPFLPNYPHSYDSNDEEQAFERRIKGEIPNLPINAENELGQAILKAISNRQDRFNSAEEFLKALENAEQQLSKKELDLVINTIMSSNDSQASVINEKKQTQATFGSDMDALEMNSTTDNSLPNNLFNTFGDSISEMPTENLLDKNKSFIHSDSDAGSHVITSADVTSPKRKQIMEEPTVSAVDKKNLNWLLYLVPLLIAIDKQHIYNLTKRINDCLHTEFGIKNLYHRMIFTACALVAKRYGALLVKNMNFTLMKNSILSTLSKSLEDSRKQNLKLDLLTEVYAEIKMNNTTNQDAINNFIDWVSEISDCVNSDYWNGEDVMGIFFNEFNRYKKKSESGQVFTPDHITSFMYRLIEVNQNDKVLEIKTRYLIQNIAA